MSPQPKTTRVLVCGSRDFENENRIFKILDELHKQFNFRVLIHGCATGADAIAERWGTTQGLKIERFPADWAKYGRGAGPIRNAQMITEGKPNLVVAFFRIKRESRGTANMVKQAMLHGIKVLSYDDVERE